MDIPVVLKRWISEGEHVQQDFKETITSSYKIAKTISAFSNCEGGRILVGIRDNGAVRGIEPEEEKHLLEIASQLYCAPTVPLTYEVLICGPKKVLVAKVPRSLDALIGAKDENTGKFWIHVRWKDNSMVASKVYIEVLKRKMQHQDALLKFGEKEKTLLNFLSEHEYITLSKFCQVSHLPFWKAQKILINFVSGGIVGIEPTNHGDRFYLANPIS